MAVPKDQALYHLIKDRSKSLVSSLLKSKKPAGQRSFELTGMEDFLKSVTNGILIFDQKLQPRAVNPAMMRMTELSGNHLTFDSVLRLFKKGGVDLEKEAKTVLANGQIFHLDKLSLFNSFYEVSVTPIRSLDGTICGGALILHDITNIEEMDRLKTEFLSIAAHQLRTPLGSIRWSIEMMLSEDMGRLSKPLRDTLMQIYQSTQRMIILVGDLLTVSRIDQSRVPDQPSKVNILEVIKDAAREVEFDLEKKSVDIKVQMAAKKTPELTIDSQRFRDVVQNLLSNAVKYNRPGQKVEVLIEGQGDDILITVKDHGIGIPKSDQKRIFSKFFRAENAVRSQTEGNGLGLYVVKSYVETWGGKVWFDSSDSGTIFYVLLPDHPRYYGTK